MKNLKFLMILIFAVGLIIQCTKDDLIDKSNSNTDGTIHLRSSNVCVATWNAQLFDVGDLFGGPQCEGTECDIRAQEICDQVAEMLNPSPDIINFQEVFEEDAAMQLIECMEANGYAFNTGFDASTNDPDCWNPLGVLNGETEGSGLITFSKHPIVNVESEDFEDCNGCTSDGNDCYADKGMILTDIELPCGTIISNLNTHLDSSDDQDDIDARRSQLEQMKEFLDANVDEDDVLLLSGDFNINRNSIEYLNMLAILGYPTNTADLAGVPDGVTSSSNTTIDYILGQNLITSTYQVYYQTTVCWWEYTEVIRTETIDQFTDLYFMELEPNGIELDEFNSGTTFDVSVVKHRFNSEEEIPFHLINKVKRVCRSYEKVEEREDKELICGYYLDISINANLGFLARLFNFSNYVEDINTVPFGIRELYVYDCILELDYMNPSDHNPILSCVSF